MLDVGRLGADVHISRERTQGDRVLVESEVLGIWVASEDGQLLKIPPHIFAQ
jgi:hypothetical protein